MIDETAKELIDNRISKVGLLGTKFTMEGDFYKNKLINKYNLKVEIPNSTDREYIHNAIYKEFAQGIFLDSTKQKFLKIIKKFSDIEGLILGCTEIPLLIKQEDVSVSLFDTLKLHLEAAVEFMLS